MRDFHDAKAMAQTLRDALADKNVILSHSESLELVSKTLGVSDWNTLSATIQNEKRKGTTLPETGTIFPAIPIRDFVPFPTSTFPLYVGREETKRALDHAFAHHRDVVLAIQKDPANDSPGHADVYDIGVLATLLDVEHLPEGLKFGDRELPVAPMKILIHAHKRAGLQRFFKETGAYKAEINEIRLPAMGGDSSTLQDAVQLFEKYATAHKINVPQTWPALAKNRDIGRVTDFISQHLALPIAEKQQLLATYNPGVRLKKIGTIMNRLMQGCGSAA